MHWTHYWRDVITCHHIIIDGWPKDVPFKNLSDGLSSLPALESLLQKWKSGTVFWRVLTDAEFVEMDSEQNASIANGTMVEPCPRHTHSDKRKKRARPQVDKQGDDTSKDESDASSINSDAHVKKHKMKSKKPHYQMSDGEA